MSQTTPPQEHDPDFVINTVSGSSMQYDKGGDSAQDAHLTQVPIVLAVPGVISLRGKNSAYKVFVGKKK